MVLCNQWQTCFWPFFIVFWCSSFALLRSFRLSFRCLLCFGFCCTWIRGCAFYCKDQTSNVVHQGR